VKYEISQAQKDKYLMISLIYRFSERDEFIETEFKRWFSETGGLDGERRDVCQKVKKIQLHGRSRFWRFTLQHSRYS
jgi:hypothetical protein